MAPAPAERRPDGEALPLRPHFALRDLTSALVVPQGFTLSIAGTLAGTIGQRGIPHIFDVWMFVVGAGLSFCVLAILSGNTRGSARPRPLSISGKATLNLVPIAVMPGAVVGAGFIPNPSVGFLVAGVLASGLYVALLAVVLRLATRRRAVTGAAAGTGPAS